MKKMLKNIAGVFIEMEDDAPNYEADYVDSKNAASAVSAVSQVSNDNDMSKFRDHFKKLVLEADLPGPDYKEYKEVLEDLKDLDEKTKYNVAFKGLKPMGLTREKLLSSIDHYLNIIEQDEKEFVKAFDGTFKDKSDTLSSVIADINVEIKALEDKIKSLEEQKQQHSKDLNNIMHNNSKEKYMMMCKLISTEIKEHLTNINKYI